MRKGRRERPCCPLRRGVGWGRRSGERGRGSGVGGKGNTRALALACTDCGDAHPPDRPGPRSLNPPAEPPPPPLPPHRQARSPPSPRLQPATSALTPTSARCPDARPRGAISALTPRARARRGAAEAGLAHARPSPHSPGSFRFPTAYPSLPAPASLSPRQLSFSNACLTVQPLPPARPRGPTLPFRSCHFRDAARSSPLSSPSRLLCSQLVGVPLTYATLMASSSTITNSFLQPIFSGLVALCWGYSGE